MRFIPEMVAGTILEKAGTVSDALSKIPSLEAERDGGVKVLGRGDAEVSRKWCWRETEGKNVNGKFGILRNYLYLCSVKHKNE